MYLWIETGRVAGCKPTPTVGGAANGCLTVDSPRLDPTRSGERDIRVARAQERYPATWLRIKSMCLFSSFGFDIDAHVAAIMLAAKETR